MLMPKPLLALLLVCAWAAAAAGEASRPLPGLSDGSLSFAVQRDAGGAALVVGGITLRPDFDADFEDPEASLVHGALSPDGVRLIVWVGHVNAKNLWVLNLVKQTTEFRLPENRGRHLFVDWAGPERFVLTYAGMGYATAYSYGLAGGRWRLLGERDAH